VGYTSVSCSGVDVGDESAGVSSEVGGVGSGFGFGSRDDMIRDETEGVEGARLRVPGLMGGVGWAFCAAATGLMVSRNKAS
jgi:hypothetical protein